MSLRIFVDFNTTQDDYEERVHVNTIHRPEYLDVLKPGLLVIFYDCEGLECDGVIEFDETHRVWCGVLDWATQRNVRNNPECP